VTGEFEQLLADYFVVGQSSKPNTFASIGHAVVLVGSHVGLPLRGSVEMTEISGKHG
jgi:hypothetical protein